MPAMMRFLKRQDFRSAAFAALIALALIALALSAGMSAAEDNQAPAGAPAPAATVPAIPPQPPPADKPGFLHQLKVWWDDSIGFFGAKIKDTGGTVEDLGKKSGDVTKGAATAATDAMKGAVEATKNAATAIVKLPNTRMIDVRERCEKAPNGAPDCEAAAANGCRAKGFAGGHPLDVRTAEKCDTTNLQAGQIPGQRACPVETVVTRAVCQ
jgi:hypothetical protein